MPRAATPVVLATQTGQGSLPGFEGFTPPLARPTAEPCSQCQTVGGRAKTPLRKPQRFSGRQFGLPGVLCDTCYEKQRYLKKCGGQLKGRPKTFVKKPNVVKSQGGVGRAHKATYEPSPEVIRQRCKAVRLLTLGGIEPSTCPDKQEARRAKFARKATQVRAEARAARVGHAVRISGQQGHPQG